MRRSIRLAIRPCLRFACSALLGLIFSRVALSEDTLSAQVRILLSRRCAPCHESTHAEGKFDLTSQDTFLRGGTSGSPIDRVSIEQSLIWQRVDHDEMPPGHPLSSGEKSLLRRWLTDGHPWPDGSIDPHEFTTESRAGRDWWSLQSIKNSPIPTTVTASSCRQPIDQFIHEKLALNGLAMSSEADPQALIRRVTFDLIGLPPSPNDVNDFLSDERPDRFERFVDRLLASPHYGERWTRHWLDVVRFGESNGFERDLPRPNAWPYRDWLVESLNDDMPYDEFARLQLAGDLLVEDSLEALRPVGFLVAGPHDTVLSVIDRMKATMRQDELEDVVGTISQTFLGLTLNCARCHDHRFDPVSTREYYQFASAFAGIDHGERQFARPEVTQQLEQLKQRVVDLANEKKNIAATSATTGTGPKGGGPDSTSTNEEAQRELAELQDRISQLTRAGVKTVYTAIATQPSVMRVHQRGSVDSLGVEVASAGLSAVHGLNPEFGLRPDAIESHRRKSLANWITNQNNPLFVRTIVNRLWHYHFGAGLVSTPNDLGFQGGLPSHPELLDWMSFEFRGAAAYGPSQLSHNPISHRFSLKRLHRLMITSQTYRQSSRNRDEAFAIDASNRWLWRTNPRRLEAEEVRDAMLSVSGQLNTEMGGKGYSDFHSHFFKGTQFYDPIDAVGPENNRRTLYRMWARGGRNPLLDQLDCPDPSTTTPRRLATVTPLQSLSLLNNAFGLRMAHQFAERLRDEHPGSTRAQVNRAYSLLFNRSPTDEESRLSIEFIERHGLTANCRAMWNSSEFLFVD